VVQILLYEIIVGLWFLGAAFFIFLGGVGRCLHTTRRSHATPPRRHLGWAPLEGPGRSYPEKRRCSAVLSAMPRRHFRLETVVFRRGGTDVPRANQRGRAALGRTQGPKPPTILAMGPLRPLQTPTAGADTAACLEWAVSSRHFRQNGREIEPKNGRAAALAGCARPGCGPPPGSDHPAPSSHLLGCLIDPAERPDRLRHLRTRPPRGGTSGWRPWFLGAAELTCRGQTSVAGRLWGGHKGRNRPRSSPWVSYGPCKRQRRVPTPPRAQYGPSPAGTSGKMGAKWSRY